MAFGDAAVIRGDRERDGDFDLVRFMDANKSCTWPIGLWA